MAAPIGSLLIGSSQVDAMKQWYRDAFGVSEDDTGAFPFGPVGLFVEEDVERVRLLGLVISLVATEAALPQRLAGTAT